MFCKVEERVIEKVKKETTEELKELGAKKKVVKCECCDGAYYKDESGKEITVD